MSDDGSYFWMTPIAVGMCLSLTWHQVVLEKKVRNLIDERASHEQLQRPVSQCSHTKLGELSNGASSRPGANVEHGYVLTPYPSQRIPNTHAESSL